MGAGYHGGFEPTEGSKPQKVKFTPVQFEGTVKVDGKEILEKIKKYEEPMDFTYATVTNEMIETAEKTLNVKLPKQYIEFLQMFGHGGIGGIEILGVGLTGRMIFVETTLDYRNGKKRMPSAWNSQICELYDLDEKQREKFTTAIAETENSVEMNLFDQNLQKRELAVSFARIFSDIDEEQVVAIKKILYGGKNK